MKVLRRGIWCIIGFVQMIQRKSILNVDYDILILGMHYLLVIGCYLVFEMIPINYRPILIEGVSLLAMTEIQVYLKVLYFSIVIGMTILEIVTIGLRNYNCVHWVQIKSKLSLFLNTTGVFLFIISQ